MTTLLEHWREGDARAFDHIVDLLYVELKRLAHARLRMERPGHTLETTGLVHEAWMKLAAVRQVRWNDRQHFLSMAARAMRRILVDSARRRNALKRGSANDIAVREADPVAEAVDADTVIELDDAVGRLESVHPRPARAIELHYFGGLSQQETAQALGVSQPTVARDLRFAIAWLGTELKR